KYRKRQVRLIEFARILCFIIAARYKLKFELRGNWLVNRLQTAIAINSCVRNQAASQIEPFTIADNAARNLRLRCQAHAIVVKTNLARSVHVRKTLLAALKTV